MNVPAPMSGTRDSPAPEPAAARRSPTSARPAGSRRAAPIADGLASFVGVLDPVPDDRPPLDEDPEYFADLHLNDIVRSVTAGRARYDLAPFYRAPARDVDTVRYRQEVFGDLEAGPALEAVGAFAAAMQRVRERLGRMSRGRYRYEQEQWYLGAANAYTDAVARLFDQLGPLPLRSRGLRGFRSALGDYVGSAPFTELRDEARRVQDGLDGITYRLRIVGDRIVVSRDEHEPDYGAEVLATFERFKQGDGREYRFEFRDSPELNHVEAAVVERVARLYPPQFAALDDFCERHATFISPLIERFDREIQFYVAYLEHVASLSRRGLAFCHPQVDAEVHELAGHGIFDLALAAQLSNENRTAVTNDFEIADPQRIIVVSGPNQGGKTTFARTIGQLHHLAGIGVPVPGTSVRVGLPDGIFTLFEREEQVEDLAGKLEDDLRRTHDMLERLTPRSVVLMNETFSSTTVNDQLLINREVLGIIAERQSWCVTVTFLDELASLGPTTLSMVSMVDPDEPARRTFKIERRPADGLAYALSIAEKHGLTYRQVAERLAR